MCKIVAFARRAVIEPLEARIAPAAVSWTGAVNSSWNTPGNWSGGQVPGAADDVTIDLASAAMVTLSTSAFTVNTLQVIGDDTLAISSGSLTVLSSASISNLVLTGGTLVGTGLITLTGTSSAGGNSNLSGLIRNEGTLAITGDPDLGGTITNAGLLTVNGRFDFITNARLDNLAGGVVDVLGTIGNGNYFGSFGGTGIFNAGTFRKSGPASANVSSVPFHNLASGILDVVQGQLTIGSEGTWDGASFTVAGGASLHLETAAKTWSGTYTGSGAGFVSTASGTISVGAAGATFNFPAGFFRFQGNATIAGNAFSNTGFITVTGDPNLGATLNNSGTIGNDARLDFVAGGRVNNLPGGVFEFLGTIGNGNYFGSFGGTGFFNEGIVRKLGPALADVSTVPFHNLASGAFDVVEGNLTIGSDGNWDGATFAVATGAMLRLESGTKTWVGNYTGSGGGIVRTGTGTISIGAAGATFSFPQGLFRFEGNATINGSPFANSGYIAMLGDPNLGTTLNNTGTITIDGQLDFVANGRVNNQPGAIFEILGGVGNGNYFGSFGGPGFFNAGIFRKSGIAVSGLSSVPFHNLVTGSIEVLQGQLNNGADGTWDGATITVSTGAIFDLSGGTKTWKGTYTGSGGGFIRTGSGTITIATGGAVLDFPEGYFRLVGDVALNGEPLINTGFISITDDPNLGTTLTNEGTILNNARLDFVAGGRLNNEGLFKIVGTVGDGNYMGNFGGQGFFNAGTFRKEGAASANVSSVPFHNLATGVIEVVQGSLGLGSSGSWDGATLNVNPGSVLRLEGGTKTWVGSYTGGGGGLVQLNGGAIVIGVAGATFDFPQGHFLWTSNADITGSGFTNTGFISVTGDPNLGATLTNTGTILNDGRWDFVSGGRLNNEPGGVLELAGTGGNGNAFGSFGGTGIFNAGIFRKSGAALLDFSTVPYYNLPTGIIEVDGGQISFSSNGTWTNAHFDVAAGATARIPSATKTWTGTFSSEGDGAVIFSNGTIVIGEAGATFDFSGSGFQFTGNSTIEGAPFINTGLMTVTGDPNLGATLNNTGVIQNNARLDFVAGGRVNNLPGGLFEIVGTAGDGNYMGNFGGAGFFNSGLFRKSGVAASDVSSVPFHNLPGGSVEVLSGQMIFGSAGNWDGAQLSVASGSILRLEGGTKTWTGTITGTGDGLVRTNSGTITIGAAGAIFDFEENLFSFEGNATINGGEWTNVGFISIAGDPNLGSILNNAGTIRNNARLDFVAGGRVNNLADGLFEIVGNAGNGNYAGNFGGVGFFNAGTFRKSGPASADLSSVPFSNAGVVEVVQGSFSIGNLPQKTGAANAGVLNGGVWKVGSGTTLDLAGSGIAVNNATIILQGTGTMPDLGALATNNGTLILEGGADFTRNGALLNAGTLTVGPGSVLTITGGFTQTLGRLEVQLGGTPASGQFGIVNIGGAAVLGGTFAVPAVNGFAPTAGNRFDLLTYASVTGAFTTFESGDQPFAPIFELITEPTLTSVNSLVDAGDLAVTDVVVPTTGLLGNNVIIEYTVSNLQNRPATASDWADVIYLSRDGVLDPTDFLFARVAHTGGLGALGAYTEIVERPVPSLPEGDYHVIVVTDSRRIVPDLDRASNVRIAATTLSLDIAELALDTEVQGTIQAGQDVFFKVTLGGGPDVFITGDFELPNAAEFFVRFNAVPDRSNFDLRATSLADLEKQIRLLNPRPGDYYILLHGREGASPESDFTLLAESAPFVLDSIGQDYGANAGVVTIPMLGGGFREGLGAELRPVGGGAAIPAQSIRIVDSFNAFATFDLAGAALGDFTFAALQEGAERIISDSFEIRSGEAGRLEARLVVPDFVRITRPFTITVEFENRGGTDIETPLLIVKGGENNFLWASGETESRMTSTLQFLGINPDGLSGGVLRPGEKYSVVLNALTNANAASFTLTSVSGDSLEAVNFPALRDSLRPDSNPSLFDTAFASVAAGLGANYGDLLDDLAVAADEARSLGAQVRTLSEAFDFLIQRQLLTIANANVRGVVYDGDLLHHAGRQSLLLEDTTAGTFYKAFSFYDGTFGFFNVPAGTYRLSVDGFFDDSVDTITVPATGVLSGLEVVGDPGAVLTGRVVDGQGRSVFGATVIATDAAGNELITTTDRNGTYRFTGVGPGEASIDITASGLVPLKDAPLTVVEGTPTIGDFTLNGGGALQGRVLNPTGGVLSGATVVARLLDGGVFTQSISTDFFGRFKLGGLLPGRYELVATGTGFGAAVLGEVQVSDGATTPVADLSLTVGGTVSGTITDSVTGLPIAGARFGPTAIGQQSIPFLSAANGGYSAANLTPGTFAALITAPGYNAAFAQITLTPGEQETLNVSLRPLGKIDGTVQIGGAVGSQVELTLLPLNSGPEAEPYMVISGTDGTFSFDGLPDGEYALSLASDGKVLGRQEFTLNAADNTHTAAVNVAGTLLSGVVRNAIGTPLAGELVQLFTGGERLDTVLTDADGRYQFLVLEPGTFDLVATSPAFGFASTAGLAITAGQATANADLSTTTNALTVQVAAAAGGVVPNALVVIRSTNSAFDDAVFGAYTGADGSVTLPGIAPGQYDISIIRSGLATEHQIITVTGNTEVEFSLATGRIIEGTVRDSAGRPLSLVEVTFRDRTTGETFVSLTDEDGNYRRSTLIEGAYDVLISDGNLRPVVLENVATGSTPVRLDATLVATGATVKGTLTDPSGNPLAGVAVRLMGGGDTALLVGFTQPDGSYEITNAPAGNFSLEVAVAGIVPILQNIVVPGAGELTQNLTTGDFIAVRREIGVIEPAPAPVAEGGVVVSGFRLGMRGGIGVFGLIDGMSGDFATGLQPPSRNDFDTASFRFGLPLPDEDCPDQVQAHLDALRTASLVNTAFEAFEGSFAALKDQNDADVAEYVALSKEILLDTVNLADGISGFKDILQNYVGKPNAGNFDFAVDRIKTAFSEIGNVQNILRKGTSGGGSLKTLGSDLLDGLRGVGDSLKDAVGSFTDIDFNTGEVSAGGDVKKLGMGGLPFVEDISKLIGKLQALEAKASTFANGTLAKRLDEYGAAEDRYLDALLKHKANRDKLDAAIRKGEEGGCGSGGSTDEDPEEPEEQKPEDEEDIPSVGSRDPNDIIGPTGFGPQNFIAADSTLNYTIRFENISTATAPAQEVFITQTLDNNLDPSTFVLGDVGFGAVFVDVPDGRDYYSTRLDLRDSLGVFVDFEGKLDVNTGVASWTFRAIDPITLDLPGDAFAGFLPPNVSSPEGEGFVHYGIRAAAGSASGTVIDAQARIVFDLNEPIDTPAIFHTLDAEAPSSQVGSLPTTVSAPRFTLNLTSGDGAGSGVHSVDIYVSDNGGAYQLFLNDFTGSSVSFRGENGHTYAFATVGKDNVGLTEDLALMADATTTVDFDVLPFSKSTKLTFTDSDGDRVTVRLSGKGQGSLILDDPDGDGSGAIDRISLDGGDTKSKITVTVKKNKNGGDGAVSIGDVRVTGSLGSFTAKQSDLVLDGYVSTGTTKSISVRDVLATEAHLGKARITLGGTNVDKTAVTLRNAGDGFELNTAGIISSLKAAAIGEGSIVSKALGKLTTTAGAMNADLFIAGAVGPVAIKGGADAGEWAGTSFGPVKLGGTLGADVTTPGKLTSLQVKGGGISGSLTAGSFGPISVTGGDVAGDIISTATNLGKKPALAKLAITGGDLLGDVVLTGALGAVSVKADKSGTGGNVSDVTIAAAKIASLTVGKQLSDSEILAGTNLGADRAIGGGDDTFASGAIGAVNIGTSVIASVIAAGLSNADGVFDNADDVILDRAKSVIASLVAKGAVDNDSYFAAGAFKGKPKFAGAVVDPLTDGRFRVI